MVSANRTLATFTYRGRGSGFPEKGGDGTVVILLQLAFPGKSFEAAELDSSFPFPLHEKDFAFDGGVGCVGVHVSWRVCSDGAYRDDGHASRHDVSHR